MVCSRSVSNRYSNVSTAPSREIEFLDDLKFVFGDARPSFRRRSLCMGYHIPKSQSLLGVIEANQSVKLQNVSLTRDMKNKKWLSSVPVRIGSYSLLKGCVPDTKLREVGPCYSHEMQICVPYAQVKRNTFRPIIATATMLERGTPLSVEKTGEPAGHEVA